MDRQEAIDIIKKNFPDGRQRLSEALKFLIPELAESEDERIKKAIKYGLDHVFTNNTIIYEVRKEQCLAWLEKQGEQKPADKVEPKFEVGDWVVVNDGRIGRIIECTKDFADVDLAFSGLSTSVNNIRSWTIQDAKEGDVLYCSPTIILFKQWEHNADCNYVIAHAGIDTGGKLQITNGSWLINNESKPATKEQRELLFSKMKEAGYEWDEEKKKLKKIEQKPAWSEEDETITNHLIALLQNSTTHNAALRTVNEEIENWLKSLKERVQPQPKQEWSEEDEENLYHINALIKDSSLEVYRQEHLSSWLASFKQKKHWKPSDEQMEVLNWCKPLWNEPKTKAVLESLIEDLKKLRKK